MDSSGSASEGSGSDNFSNLTAGTVNSRERTDSESSDNQTRFVLPGANGVPSKVITMGEVQDLVKNIQNMALAHEIAINPEFKLTQFEPPENSLEKRVKDVVHRAFWNLLREQLNSVPPCYDHAIQLLGDIKELFQQIFLQNNRKTMERISEVLDANLIRQQAEQGVLDFKAYSDFVIDVMARSCAPVRDEQVAALTEIVDVVEKFKGILETLSVMKLDVANCLLAAARNEVIANSVRYEKEKFKKYLEHYHEGFPATEEWLKRHKQAANTNVATATSTTSQPAGTENVPKQTITNAYLELMDWNPEYPLPEMLSMDTDRIAALQSRAMRLCVCVSTLAVTSGLPIISQNPDLKKSLAKQIEILLQNVNTRNELNDAMQNVWLQIKTVISDKLKNQSVMDEQTETTLKNQVLEIAKKDSPVSSLIWKRFIIYLRLIMYSKATPPPPPGFTEFIDELEKISTAFKVLVSYNYSVFGEYYHEMLAKQDSSVEQPQSA